VIGRATIAAARTHGGSDLFLGEMLAQRLDQCRTFKTAPDHFLGWSRRCFAVHLEALKETVS
jgi:lysozyme family protein